MGKSTLLLQALGRLAAGGTRCLLVTAEESCAQVRCGPSGSARSHSDLLVVAETSLPHVLAHADASRAAGARARLDPDRLDPDLPGAPGSVTQVRDCAYRLVQHAKEHDRATVLVGHVTKEGTLAGPRVLEHVVDTVLSFDGDRGHSLRAAARAEAPLRRHRRARPVRDDRARPGRRARRVGALPGRSSPRRARLGGGRGARRRAPDPGRGAGAGRCATAAPMPRRSAAGIESGRLAMLLAVLEQHAGVQLDRRRRLRERRRWSARHRARARPRARARGRGRAAVAGHRSRRTRSRSASSVSAGRCGRSRSSTAGSPKRRASGSAARVVPTGARPVGHRRLPGLELRRACATRSARRCTPVAREPGEPGVSATRLRYLSRHSPAPTRDEPAVPAPPRSEAMMVALRLVAPGTPAARGPRPHPAGAHGRADRGRRRARGALGVLGRLPARRRVHAPAPLGAGQDGRRHHPRVRQLAGRPRQRAPRPRSQRAHVGDRHPPPHRRAGRPPARRPGDHRVGRHVGGRDPPPRREAHARADPARARPGRPGAADPRALQGPPRLGERLAVGARGRRPRDRARRRHRAAARRDGAPHRRGDRGLRHRARRRRPARDAPARGADRRRRRRPPARGQGLLPGVRRLRARAA